MEMIKSLLDRLNIRQAHFIMLTVAAALLLFAPEQWRITLGVDQLAKDYKTYIGLFFIAGMSYWIVEIFGYVRYAYIALELKRTFLKRMNELTEYEKAILRFYISAKTRTNLLKFDDGVVQGLVAAGIIYVACATGDNFGRFEFNISQAAWECLNKNPGMLKGTTTYIRSGFLEDRG